MSERSKSSEELSVLEFVKKKARKESNYGQSVNLNKETFKLTNRNNVKENSRKKAKVDDNIKNARTYASSKSKVVKWQK